MELSLSGNALKTFHRSVTSLARIGTDLVLRASPAELVLHTLNSSRSAYQSVAFKPDFLDSFRLLHAPSSSSSSSSPVVCSVLLKSVCSVLRTPATSVDRLSALLPSPDATKLQWTLQCHNGVKKTYWINCNAEPDIQNLSLDRRRFPSSFIVRPRDLTRLLSNFQSSLHEITIIATEPSAMPSDAGTEIGGKAVELRSYIDPAKDNSDSALHTQLWIDPADEFLQYTHVGNPVDVTFGVKELKAFLSFCEGCEVDIHLFFEKAGEPILMAPRFGFDDSSNSDFDATLVLATMLVSQLTEGNATMQPPTASVPHAHDVENGSQSRATTAMNAAGLENPSDHTKIWSDLSGSAARIPEDTRDRQAHMQDIPNSSAHNVMERPDAVNVSKVPPTVEKIADTRLPMEIDHMHVAQGRTETNANPYSQHHPSNWVAADDDDEEDEGDLYVQSTPQYDD